MAMATASHETLLHILWDLIHIIRGEEDVI
jgi:hypothetical protein